MRDPKQPLVGGAHSRRRRGAARKGESRDNTESTVPDQPAINITGLDSPPKEQPGPIEIDKTGREDPPLEAEPNPGTTKDQQGRDHADPASSPDDTPPWED